MADDPSVYLRPAREITDPTKIFDSKKWLWIPHDDEGFVKANVKSTKGDKVVVELTDGQVRQFDKSLYYYYYYYYFFLFPH